MPLTPEQIGQLSPEERKNLAKTSSPAALWERWGFTVYPTGNELRILRDGGCIYRSVKRDDGIWFSTRADAGCHIDDHVGDNISLFQYFEPLYLKEKGEWARNFNFHAAIVNILSLVDETKRPKIAGHPGVHESKTMKLPQGTCKKDTICEEYLRGRGISRQVIEDCVEKGILRFSPESQNFAASLLFIGTDMTGAPAFATRRVAGEMKEKDIVAKRDLKNSNKAWVPMYPGTDTVVFVEGGVNLLSVVEIWQRAGLEIPTVVMTGGQGSLAWKENPKILDALARTSRVFFMMENDFHLSDTDRNFGLTLKNAQADTVRRISGIKPVMVMLPEVYNDINDVVNAGEGFHDDLKALLEVVGETGVEAPRA